MLLIQNGSIKFGLLLKQTERYRKHCSFPWASNGWLVVICGHCFSGRIIACFELKMAVLILSLQFSIREGKRKREKTQNIIKRSHKTVQMARKVKSNLTKGTLSVDIKSNHEFCCRCSCSCSCSCYCCFRHCKRRGEKGKSDTKWKLIWKTKAFSFFLTLSTIKLPVATKVDYKFVFYHKSSKDLSRSLSLSFPLHIRLASLSFEPIPEQFARAACSPAAKADADKQCGRFESSVLSCFCSSNGASSCSLSFSPLRLAKEEEKKARKTSWKRVTKQPLNSEPVGLKWPLKVSEVLWPILGPLCLRVFRCVVP